MPYSLGIAAIIKAFKIEEPAGFDLWGKSHKLNIASLNDEQVGINSFAEVNGMRAHQNKENY